MSPAVAEDGDDRYLTRREVALILEKDQERFVSRREWEAAIEAGMAASEERWRGHTRQHENEATQVALQLAAAHALYEHHSKAHDREHAAAQLAIDKADLGVSRRFDAALGLLETTRGDIDRRFSEVTKQGELHYEENRRRIEALEKGDVKEEGKGAGQAAVWAVIIASIGAIGGILSVLIMLSNAIERGP